MDSNILWHYLKIYTDELLISILYLNLFFYCNINVYNVLGLKYDFFLQVGHHISQQPMKKRHVKSCNCFSILWNWQLYEFATIWWSKRKRNNRAQCSEKRKGKFWFMGVHQILQFIKVVPFFLFDKETASQTTPIIWVALDEQCVTSSSS